MKNKPLDLIKQFCPQLLPVDLGQQIGIGAHGQVCELSDPNQVIKFSILYDVNCSQHIEEIFQEIRNTYGLLLEREIKPLMRIFDFRQLYKGKREIVDGTQEYIIYSSIMEKLNSITDDEEKVLKTICEYLIGSITLRDGVKKTLEELHQYLTFDLEKVLAFYQAVVRCPILHNDLSTRNVMKRTDGEFCLIDIDLATRRKEND